jgi:hypothetical protein
MQPSRDLISDEQVFRIARYIDSAAKENGLDPALLIVMTYGESRFDPTIVNIMQISQTWYANDNAPSYCRFARKSQQASIRCGAFVLSECSRRFKTERSRYLCWSGFHIQDKDAYLERIKDRWELMK